MRISNAVKADWQVDECSTAAYGNPMSGKTFRDRVLPFLEKDENLKRTALEADVSYNVLIKLKRGDSQSTTADNARKLERYYGLASDGFSEPEPQPRIDVLSALERAGSPAASARAAPETEIKVAVVGRTIQVFATVDLDTLPELLRRLDLARQMIDPTG